MSQGWSYYVIAIVAINIIGAMWLLFYTSRKRPGEHVEGEDTGHVWDGDLVELNNPMPRWWLLLFVFTTVFAVGYLVLYPGAGSFAGTLGWSQTAQYDAEVVEVRAREAELFAAFAGMDVEALAREPQALATGARIFANTCSTCHGSDGRGAAGFPNLTDGEWLYGGDGATLELTITNGRNGMMPALGATLGEQGVAEVAAYVHGLGGRPAEPAMAALASRGQQTFATICAACHGPDGKGNPLLGAPDLTNDAWLYGGDYETIKTTITHGRAGRMPAHGATLGEQKVRLVAAYVRSLSAPPK
jgi:cytochrome c oxidase cbb3-type subunit 3